MVVKGRVLLAGSGEGPLLRLAAPLSFWGGVDPKTGLISDPRHPQHGYSIAGTVLALAEPCGSSSSSAVMLELLAGGHAPAALVLGEVDAILALGIVVAREMGYGTIPALEVPPDELALLPEGRLRVASDGTISAVG